MKLLPERQQQKPDHVLKSFMLQFDSRSLKTLLRGKKKNIENNERGTLGSVELLLGKNSCRNVDSHRKSELSQLLCSGPGDESEPSDTVD